MLSDVVCMLLLLFIQLQPSVALCLFIISASVLCLLLDLCDCMFWLCSVFVLMFVLEVLEERLDELCSVLGGVSTGCMQGQCPGQSSLSRKYAEQAVGISQHTQMQTHTCTEGGKLLGEDPPV